MTGSSRYPGAPSATTRPPDPEGCPRARPRLRPGPGDGRAGLRRPARPVPGAGGVDRHLRRSRLEPPRPDDGGLPAPGGPDDLPPDLPLQLPPGRVPAGPHSRPSPERPRPGPPGGVLVPPGLRPPQARLPAVAGGDPVPEPRRAPVRLVRPRHRGDGRPGGRPQPPRGGPVPAASPAGGATVRTRGDHTAVVLLVAAVPVPDPGTSLRRVPPDELLHDPRRGPRGGPDPHPQEHPADPPRDRGPVVPDPRHRWAGRGPRGPRGPRGGPDGPAARRPRHQPVRRVHLGA